MAAPHSAAGWDGQVRAVEDGEIGGYHVVYERAPNNRAAKATDMPGVMATGKTRADVERVIWEVLTLYFETDDIGR